LTSATPFRGEIQSRTPLQYWDFSKHLLSTLTSLSVHFRLTLASPIAPAVISQHILGSPDSHVRATTISHPMPGRTEAFEVLLDFTNDTHDAATVQLLRDYGRSSSTIVLLHPGESITLVLDAGVIYQYALKTRSKVANVTARTWRNVNCPVSQLFPGGWPSSSSDPWRPMNGITVERLWRDMRFCMWND